MVESSRYFNVIDGGDDGDDSWFVFVIVNLVEDLTALTVKRKRSWISRGHIPHTVPHRFASNWLAHFRAHKHEFIVAVQSMVVCLIFN